MKNKKRLLSLVAVVLALMLPISACDRLPDEVEDVSGEQELNLQTGEPGLNQQPGGVKETMPPEEAKVYLSPISYNVGFTSVYGYADAKGNTVIEPRFNYAQPFYECGLATVTDSNDMSGLIDEKGNYVVEPKYSYFTFTGGIFLGVNYEENFTTGYDQKGNELFRLDGYFSEFSDGYCQWYSKGYIDTKGELTIPLDYEELGSFKNGIARVAEEYMGPAFYINTKGEDVTDKISSGLRMFKEGELYGYKNTSGEIVIPAQFSEAEPFLNGYAIVKGSPSMERSEYGVIDTKGAFILHPVYCGMNRLSNGLVAVGEEVLVDVWYPPMYLDYSVKALYTPDFKEHTDWLYYLASDFDEDTICVNDEESVFFMDKNLKPSKELPVFKGQGAFSKDGDLLRGQYNAFMTVADKKGNILTGNSNLIDLGEGIKAKQTVITASRTSYLSYPVISGLKDEKTQKKVNDLIKAEMVDPYGMDMSSGEGMELSIFEADFALTRQKNLLLIDQGLYYYTLGAAHGSHFMNTAYIDLEKGAAYQLNDLFKPDSDVYSYLSENVSAQMVETMEEVGYWEDHVEITPETGFIITKEGLVLYFAEYEIASYAAGMPEFLIPYDDLKEYINTDGDFWKSFN